MKKCRCGQEPEVKEYKSAWLVMCWCGNHTFGIGTSRFSAVRIWNRSRKHQIRMERNR